MTLCGGTNVWFGKQREAELHNASEINLLENKAQTYFPHNIFLHVLFN